MASESECQTDESARHAAELRETRLGIFAMLGSMAAFTANDTCIKLLGERLPVGEIITFRNAVATSLLLLICWLKTEWSKPITASKKLVGLRVAMDALASLTLVAGVIFLPIADATAIHQLTPLVLTLSAALYLKHRVENQVLLATLVGLFAVALIIRPGTSAFTPAAMFPLAAVLFVTVRDIATRQLGNQISIWKLAALSAAAGTIAGFIVMAGKPWIWPHAREFALLLASGALVVIAYVLIIVAMRHGDLSIVSPFRYAVIAFALLPGWLIWSQVPDVIQMIGMVLLTLAGVYTYRCGRTPTG